MDKTPERKVAIGPMGNAMGYFFVVLVARSMPDLFADMAMAVAMAGAMFTFILQYWVPNK